MSASTRTAPAQLGLGGFPSTFAALALVIILAVAVAVVALGAAKSAPAADAAPAFNDHGSRGELVLGAGAAAGSVQYILDRGSRDELGASSTGTTSFGGWNGPRAVAPIAGDATKDDVYIPEIIKGSSLKGSNGANGPALRPQ